jgi:hypothetical protein
VEEPHATGLRFEKDVPSGCWSLANGNLALMLVVLRLIVREMEGVVVGSDVTEGFELAQVRICESRRSYW